MDCDQYPFLGRLGLLDGVSFPSRSSLRVFLRIWRATIDAPVITRMNGRFIEEKTCMMEISSSALARRFSPAIMRVQGC